MVIEEGKNWSRRLWDGKCGADQARDDLVVAVVCFCKVMDEGLMLQEEDGRVLAEKGANVEDECKDKIERRETDEDLMFQKEGCRVLVEGGAGMEEKCTDKIEEHVQDENLSIQEEGCRVPKKGEADMEDKCVWKIEGRGPPGVTPARHLEVIEQGLALSEKASLELAKGLRREEVECLGKVESQMTSNTRDVFFFVVVNQGFVTLGKGSENPAEGDDGADAQQQELSVGARLTPVVEGDADEVCAMQRGRGDKRPRAPTPRRRRIPARGSNRTYHNPTDRMQRRASWMRTPSRPTCSSSVARVPWRSRRENRGRDDRGGEREDAPERTTVDLTGGAAASTDPGIPPLDDGTRTWAELVGLLDPMNESEQLIAPVVLEGAVERLREMDEEERRRVAVSLVRFLAVFYAEILQMLNAADHGDVVGLLQVGKDSRQSRGKNGLKLRQGNGRDTKIATAGRGSNLQSWENEESSLMQVGVDKFGALLQKLLVLFERMSKKEAAVRASFMKEMLTDVQRPGTHVNAAVVDRMDRLQALLLSFEEDGDCEAQEVDREWCFQQWEILRETLMAKTSLQKLTRSEEGGSGAAGSTDVVQVVDSQESQEQGCSSMVAVLQNGTTRPLTSDEEAEVAYHEDLEQRAAEEEAHLDAHRWSLFRAQCLQDEEDEAMKTAMEDGEDVPPHKKARVRVVVEGEGGRVVRSEVFNMVVRDGESLTYKIMVLPKDDPEVQALRQQQEHRQQGHEQGHEQDGEEESSASAETVPVDAKGKAIPEPVQVPEQELEAFMKTPEGERYYQKWLRGDITCKMVRMRSGAGLLAKFHGRKVDDEEDAKMLKAVLQAEASHTTKEDKEKGDKGVKEKPENISETASLEPSSTRTSAARTGPEGGLRPPSSWPSYEVPGADTQVDEPSQSHPDVPGHPCPPELRTEKECDEYQLALEVAEEDVVEPAVVVESGPQQGQDSGGANGEETAGTEGEGISPGAPSTMTGQSTESTSEPGGRQSDLKHWLL